MLKPFAAIFSAAVVGLSAPIIGVLPGDSQVDITWQAPTTPVDFVAIEQSTNGGATWKQIDQVPGITTHYLVDSVQNGTNYWYRIRWILNGIPSNPSQAIIANPASQPDIPTSLVGVGGDGQVSLQWDVAPVGSKVVGYAIEDSSDGGTTWTTAVTNTGSPSGRWLVDGLKNGLTYSFRVKAIDFNGVSGDWSASASVIVGVLKDDSFTLDGQMTPVGVDLAWSQPSLATTLDTYRVELSTDGGMTWSNVVEFDAGVQKASVPYVLGGALYRVIATSITGEHAMSLVSLVQIVDDPNGMPSADGALAANAALAIPNSQSGSGSQTGGLHGNSASGGVTTDVNGGVGTRKTLPSYNIQATPKKVVDTSIASLALLGLISGAGAAAANAAKRNEDDVAALEGIDYEDLERLEGFEEYGDRSKSWRLPNIKWTVWAERFTHSIATQVNRVSPLMGRMVVDGSYLRAMYGALALATWMLAIGLTILTVIQTGGEALPPKPLTMIALILIGVLDAGAAMLASTLVIIGTAILGGFSSIPAGRTTIGLVILWVAPSLIASAARPLRRPRPITYELNEMQKWQWERAGDYVVGPLLAALAVRTMVKGLPALAGLHLPIVNQANLLAILTALFVLTRYALEENASRNYPLRLQLVEASELNEPFTAQRHFSLVLRALLFALVALPFMGNVWQLYVGTAMFIFPAILSAYAHHLPRLPQLFQIIPTGIPQFTLMLYIGAAYSAWVSTLFHGATSARMGFVLLSIPGFVISILNQFAGEPEPGVVKWYMRENFKWVYRIGAIYLILSAAYLALK